MSVIETISPPATDGGPATPGGDKLFLNRELSWLDFNQRVLDLARDPSFPLLERVKFLAIFASNTDEFFMKRIGGLHRQRESKVSDRSIDGLTVDEQLNIIHARLLPLLESHNDTWLNELQPALEREGIVIRKYEELDDAGRAVAADFFQKQVFPILTPLAVDPGHPFPFISNLSKSIGVMLEHAATSAPTFVRIKVPENLPRWIPLPVRHHFLPLEQIIVAHLSMLFPGMKVLETQLFRITRNADTETDEEDADDLLDMIEKELRMRRLAGVVRLELPTSMSASMRDFIVNGLEVKPEDVYVVRGPVDLDDMMALSNLDIPALRFKPWVPLVPPRLRDDDSDIFSVIRAGDLIVHHPYEDFGASVERFVAAAASDPKVLALKMTLYRTSGDSPFVPAMIRAAEMGKQVAVLVELKARFDEQRNVELAQKLEKAGVHVVYGLVGLKTHAKIAMAVRDEPDGLRTYCHLGTGNYNSKTAQLYTDLGLFTCNPAITSDVIELFHHLTGRSVKRDYQKLFVAPVNMRERFLSRIRREIDHAKAGRPARIAAKMNALQDSKVIKSLYEASQAGVKVDLIIRGFCCLRPGVPGMSENIRVISILGRFLEHSRIFYFQNGDPAGAAEEYFIGSADWMNRNLDYRVEAITPIEDSVGRAILKDILDTMMTDVGHAWELQPDGLWKRREQPEGRVASDTQDLMMARALRQAKRSR